MWFAAGECECQSSPYPWLQSLTEHFFSMTGVNLEPVSLLGNLLTNRRARLGTLGTRSSCSTQVPVPLSRTYKLRQCSSYVTGTKPYSWLRPAPSPTNESRAKPTTRLGRWRISRRAQSPFLWNAMRTARLLLIEYRIYLCVFCTKNLFPLGNFTVRGL